MHLERPVWANALITLGLLGATCLVSVGLNSIAQSTTAATLLFVLCVHIVARVTDGYFWGIAASVVAVLCVNFIFTFPYMAFNFAIAGYPLTFATMLAVSISTSALTTVVKKQDKLRLESERARMRADLLRAPDLHRRLRRPAAGERRPPRGEPPRAARQHKGRLPVAHPHGGEPALHHPRRRGKRLHPEVAGGRGGGRGRRRGQVPAALSRHKRAHRAARGRALRADGRRADLPGVHEPAGERRDARRRHPEHHRLRLRPGPRGPLLRGGRRRRDKRGRAALPL